MEIGILGGTFDPIHLGHLVIAEAAREQLGLSKVIFIPAGEPWLKSDREISAPHHRLEMIRRAISDSAEFEVSPIETDRPGPSYSVDTLASLKRQFGPEGGLHFIVGSDALAGMPRWKDPAMLVSLCRIVAVRRADLPAADLSSLEREIPGISARTRFLDAPTIGISATDIRDRIRNGRSVRYLVPPPVEAYIRRHRLYR